MPGCAAVGCNNRSEKGYIMKCFPRDPILRKIWQERVARANWEPSNNSFLCHIHFKPEQWSITQTGRIRLKKYAVPSIFTVTSTRKSPKKRKKMVNVKKEDKRKDDASVEYLENDTEHSSTGQCEEKDSDDQEDAGQLSAQLLNSGGLTNLNHEKKPPIGKICRTITYYEHEDYTSIVSDEAMQENNVALKMRASEKKADDTELKQQCRVDEDSSIKCEIKREIMEHNALDDSYDEIEEKLKQICDGGPVIDEVRNNRKRSNSINAMHESSKQETEVNHSFNNNECRLMSEDVDYKYSTKSEVGHILNDKTENVEIIFGTESGDDKTCATTSTTPSKHSMSKNENNHSSNFNDLAGIKEERKIFIEDIEENFSKDEVHVIPNIRAAMKRKRRTREEIMKSIKKSIGSASEQEISIFSNDESSEDSTDKETKMEKQPLCIESRRCKKSCTLPKRVKFTIKVTGDPEDVTDVIDELSSKTTNRYDSQDIDALNGSSDINSFITSVITIEDYPPSNSLVNSGHLGGHELLETNRSTLQGDSEKISYPVNCKQTINLCKSMRLADANFTCNEHQFIYSKGSVSSDEDSKSIDIDIDLQTQNFTCGAENLISSSVSTPYDFHENEELRRRAKLQEEVIEKLTSQLIIYKSIETSLRNKNLVLQAKTKEMETLSHKLCTRSTTSQGFIGKKSVESKQRLIDLSNRVNYLDDLNKKLMKTVTLESQQKRKLEGQIKQRDTRIKELNWKLEKASKYLERAEKNTNTYRRKMLNMQTVMRRKKVLDEKMNKFNEVLTDNTKEDFSEKALKTAMDIRKTCGKKGYDKLLSCGLPFPPVQILQKRFLNNDFSDCNENNDKAMQSCPVKQVVKSEDIRDTKCKDEFSAKDSNISESDIKEAEFEGTETVTGTVQDIFDENNDGDDFSTNELREHFILQLNAVM